MKTSILVSLVVGIIWTCNGLAATETTVTAKATSPLDRIGLSYDGLITGGTFERMDGVEGEGTGVRIEHYFRPSYKLDGGWSLSVTQLITQYLDRGGADGKNPKDRFSFFLPYVTAFKTNFLPEGWKIKMPGYFRYYIPIGSDDKNLGGKTDSGIGRFRARIFPNIALTDKLKFTLTTTYQHYLAGEPADTSFQHVVMLFNNLSYQVTDKFSVFAEYGVIAYGNYGGNWGKWFKQGDGDNIQYVEAGASFSVLDNVSVTPYADFYPAKDNESFLSGGEWGLLVSYKAF